MPLWDRVRDELSHAGRVAQNALDEGRLRLDLLRARNSADRFARQLGYALFRARQAGGEIAPDDYAAHSKNLAASEAEIARLETLIKQASDKWTAPPLARP